MPRHLLIVDDSALVTDALRILFEESGLKVTTANSVASAVACATAERADVMLLDLTLPDGDGLSIIDHLRARDALPGVVIAVTGHDDDDLRARCIAAGCQSVLFKPVPTWKLLTMVQSL
jgi:CheY-like chemotaxis protein